MPLHPASTAQLSGNDISVLINLINAILAANVNSGVCNQAQQEAFMPGNDDNLYYATGSYPGMNGNYSFGILESIIHYIPDVKRRLS